ncbi:uncharacterized protein WCC33_004942 [Rhinophrynus dorsalis]
MATDAFLQSWIPGTNYAFPPFAMIPRNLMAIRRQQATVVLITPFWPMQPWFPPLLELSTDFPHLLPSFLHLLTGPSGDPHELLASGDLHLLDWRLSGVHSASVKFRTVLFTVDRDFTARAGVPPRNFNDRYDARAARLGTLVNAEHIAFSPNGCLFAVRGENLYRGCMPSCQYHDWFCGAKRVGRGGWQQFKFLIFHPNGLLYGATKRGEFYMGPPPDDENVSWINGRAIRVGTCSWNLFDALFFDPQGILHAVTTEDTLVKRHPPAYALDNWIGTSTTIGKGGWRVLTHFMSFSPDGNLWCVNKWNGYIYSGRPPPRADISYIDKATFLGCGYNHYRLFAFTRAREVQSILSFKFLPESGKILSENTEVLEKQLYDNRRSSTPINHTFAFNKTIKEMSHFNHGHGFTFVEDAEAIFKTGIPFFDAKGMTISVNMSNTQNWSFNRTNEREVWI